MSDFNSWYRRVNNILANNIGFTADDLPDANWRDYYEDGLTPLEGIMAGQEDGYLGIPQELLEPLEAYLTN